MLAQNVNYAVKCDSVIAFLGALPEVLGKLKSPYRPQDRKSQDVLNKEAQDATALVIASDHCTDVTRGNHKAHRATSKIRSHRRGHTSVNQPLAGERYPSLKRRTWRAVPFPTTAKPLRARAPCPSPARPRSTLATAA